MIQNERQYKVTKGQISKLESAISIAKDGRDSMNQRIYSAMISGIKSQIEELQEQLREYEVLLDATTLRLTSTDTLPQLLIKGRIARGLSQKELAEKLKIKPQQVQKYETTQYRSAKFQRVLDIMKVLELNLESDIPLKMQNIHQKDSARNIIIDQLTSEKQQKFLLNHDILKLSTGVDFDRTSRELMKYEGI